MAQMFDFDELDELEDRGQPSSKASQESASTSKCTDVTADGGSSDYSDGLSEVWPGEDLHDADLGDLAESREFDEVAEVATWWNDSAGGNDDDHEVNDDDHEVWEVVFGPRIVIRLQPRLDASVVGIGSKEELFFGDPHGSDAGWVKLSHENGYILKDGRIKDPRLGMLLEPYDFGDVPEHARRAVSATLRSAWVEARRGSGAMFLRPPLIAKLRRGHTDAVRSACQHGAFDLEAFKASFKASADAVAAAALGGVGTSQPSTSPPTAPKQLTSLPTYEMQFFPSQGGIDAATTSLADSPPSLADAEFDGEVTPAFASSLSRAMANRSLPSEEDVRVIVLKATRLFTQLNNLVQLTVPPEVTLHVVGDLHGQFWDLLHIIETSGAPSKDNWYLFNGDFVDRGQFSVEVVILLFAWKVALPKYVHLNRGNHESFRMNVIYGFMQEVKQKYSADVFSLFTTAFKNLPLATVVNESVLIVHGGLSRKEGFRLQEIARVDRKREPDEWADDMMVDLLWSDPSELAGQNASPRGAGILFGADVTKKLCDLNSLTCVIRSHEMKYNGFEWQHDNKCLTVFSAANYCDMCGNFGAVCDITPKRGKPKIAFSDLECRRFEASPHPNERRQLGA